MSKLHARARAVAVAIGVAILGAGGAVHAADTKVGDLTITKPWTRATPGGAKVGGAFMTITNNGTSPDRLVGGDAIVSGAFEVHEMSMTDGIMKMRRLEKGLEIKPGETVELKPGSYHVMFLELKEPIAMSTPVKGTLVFEKAGTVEVTYQVAPIGARSLDGNAGHGGGAMGGHGAMKKGQH